MTFIGRVRTAKQRPRQKAMPFRRLALSAGVWLLSACGGEAPASHPEEEQTDLHSKLVASYTDSEAICGQYDECGLFSVTECESGFPTPNEVRRALGQLDWSTKQQSRCLEAVTGLDDCVVELDCEDVVSYSHAFFSTEEGWNCVEPSLSPDMVPRPARCPAPIPCQEATETWATDCAQLEVALP